MKSVEKSFIENDKKCLFTVNFFHYDVLRICYIKLLFMRPSKADKILKIVVDFLIKEITRYFYHVPPFPKGGLGGILKQLNVL